MFKAERYTVAQWCRLWHENYCKPNVRETTAEYYRNYIENHIVPALGDIKLCKLTTLELQQFYNQVKAGGRVKKYDGMKDRSLSARTVRGLHIMLHLCLNQAVQERLILYNPAAGCRLPPKEKKEMQIIINAEEPRKNRRPGHMSAWAYGNWLFFVCGNMPGH